MRFIPAVSGVQIPPLLPEYNGSPGSSRASSFLRQGTSRVGASGSSCGEARSLAERAETSRTQQERRQARAGLSGMVAAISARCGGASSPRGCGRAAGGKKVLAKRQCPFCRWMRAPRSRPHKIGQGSSVGQSMRSIPAVSGGTLPCYQRIKKPGLWKSWAFLFCCTASRICSLPGHAQPGSATGKASAPAQKQVASGSVPDEVTGVFVPQCLKDQ